MVEGFGDVPRVTLCFGDGLQVAARKVEPDPVAENRGRGLACIQIVAASFQCHHHFDLVMQIRGGLAGKGHQHHP